MKLQIITLLASMTALTYAQPAGKGATPLFLTMTNGGNNFLAVVNASTGETDYVPTGGIGGVGGNSSGVAVSGAVAAVVNFGSTNVSVFERQGDSMQPMGLIKTQMPPVSVAFGHGHMVVLETTMAESFPMYGNNVSTTPDGQVALTAADGSAAQIITYAGGAMVVEKSGAVGWMSLSTEGAPGLSGPEVPVALPPAPNNSTPLGMAARGANVYLSIAHSDLQALIVNGKIISQAAGPGSYKDANGNITHAPCWNALSGQFMYSTDSPGQQIYRYLVSDSNIFFDIASVATFAGKPTDITVSQNLMGVIDGGNGITSNASLFDIDSEGELALRFAVKIAGPINGAAIIR